MDEYVKINTIWKRDERGRIIEGEYATPELEFLSDGLWDWTEKVDGTNIRVSWDGTTIEFGGRTDNAQIPAKLVSALREMFSNALMRETFPLGDEPVAPIILYGEGYGAGIQSGGNYRPDQSFVLFDVMVGRWWLDREAVQDVANKLDIPVVPLRLVGQLRAASEWVKTGQLESAWGTFPAEGLVGRPRVDLFDRKGQRIMAKIKARDFRP